MIYRFFLKRPLIGALIFSIQIHGALAAIYYLLLPSGVHTCSQQEPFSVVLMPSKHDHQSPPKCQDDPVTKASLRSKSTSPSTTLHKNTQAHVLDLTPSPYNTNPTWPLWCDLPEEGCTVHVTLILQKNGRVRSIQIMDPVHHRLLFDHFSSILLSWHFQSRHDLTDVQVRQDFFFHK